MKKEILYLTTFPPEKSGIADYAKCFAESIDQYTEWDIVQFPREMRTQGNSFQDLHIIKQRVSHFIQSGLANQSAFIHAEVGYHSHDEFYTLYFLSRLIPEYPYYITVHDPPLVIAPALYPMTFGIKSTALRRGIRLLDYTPIAGNIIRNVLCNAKSVFVLSERGSAALKSIGISNVTVIPHIYLAPKNEKILSKSIEEPINVLFLSFWTTGKGLDILPAAIEIVMKSTNKNVRFILAGGAITPEEQQFRETVLRQIEKSEYRNIISTPGYLPSDLIDKTIDEADIYLLPYTKVSGYSASGALIRAMQAGCAVIANDVGTFGEDIINMETGLLIPTNDVKALSSAILKLVTDNDLRHRLGAAAQKKVFSSHSPECVMDVVDGVYNATLGPYHSHASLDGVK